jgi:hypothetical protein
MIAQYLLRHQISEFVPQNSFFHQSDAEMSDTSQKFPLLSKVGERIFSGTFLGLALLAVAGWVYLLSEIFVKFVVWCFDYFSQ